MTLISDESVETAITERLRAKALISNPVGRRAIMEERIYYDANLGLRRAIELHSQGVPLFCPRCKRPLTVALSQEELERFKCHPGIFCPTSLNHVCVFIDFRH